MRSTILLFISLVVATLSAAQEWQVAVIATSDNVHAKQGGAVQNGNMFTIKAGGNDIWGNADQFTFVYQEISGDFEMTVTVHSLENTNDWAKSGIMARQDLDPGSINVLAACRALEDLVTFQRRETKNGSSSSERLTPSGAQRPITIKLIRTGNEFTGAWSKNGGKTWEKNVTKDGVTATPPVNLNLIDPILLGIAVTSHAEGSITTSVVEIVSSPFGGISVDSSGKLATIWARIK